MNPHVVDEVVKIQSKKRVDRTPILNANFVNGYAEGWAFAVPECFRASLDIWLTPRVQKDPATGIKKDVMIWTQGQPPIYQFSQGETLYNTKAVYEKVWSEALSEISVGLQVAVASPDTLKQGKSKGFGSVVVTEFRVRSDGSRIDGIKKHRMTQDEFVSVLKTGRLADGTLL